MGRIFVEDEVIVENEVIYHTNERERHPEYGAEYDEDDDDDIYEKIQQIIANKLMKKCKNTNRNNICSLNKYSV